MFLLAIVATQDSNDPAQGNLLSRLGRFLARPLHEKSKSVYARWKRLFPTIPFPVRLPFGAWFIGRNDLLGRTLASDSFEVEERAFVKRFLQPGMTVLDIGAHHGFYTLLCWSIVGPKGKVFAFEPSPRERKALRLNALLNRSKNVFIQPFAVGEVACQSQIYVVAGEQTGFNSLRRPAVNAATVTVPVAVTTLDDLIAKRIIEHPDFIKLDVEGAELSSIRGARKLLEKQPRPVLMVEVESVRTEPWGYAAIDIIAALEDLGFSWFKPLEDGLRPINKSTEKFVGNLVAIPVERCETLIPRDGQSC